MRTYTIKEIQDACMHSGMSLYATTCLLNKLKSMPSEEDSALNDLVDKAFEENKDFIEATKDISAKIFLETIGIVPVQSHPDKTNKDVIEDMKKQSGLISDQTLPVFPLERRYTKKNPDGSITFIRPIDPYFIRTNSITIKDEGEE